MRRRLLVMLIVGQLGKSSPLEMLTVDPNNPQAGDCDPGLGNLVLQTSAQAS